MYVVVGGRLGGYGHIDFRRAVVDHIDSVHKVVAVAVVHKVAAVAVAVVHTAAVAAGTDSAVRKVVDRVEAAGLGTATAVAADPAAEAAEVYCSQIVSEGTASASHRVPGRMRASRAERKAVARKLGDRAAVWAGFLAASETDIGC